MTVEKRAIYTVTNEKLSRELDFLKSLSHRKAYEMLDLIEALEKKVGRPVDGPKEHEWENLKYLALYIAEHSK